VYVHTTGSRKDENENEGHRYREEGKSEEGES
jgi:hypothetical protein